MKKLLLGIIKFCTALVCLGLMGALLLTVGLSSGRAQQHSEGRPADVAIMDRFDMYMNNGLSTALDGVLTIDKVYWLKDDDLIAPKPDADKFGTAYDPATLDWLLEDAQGLLDGQETVFNTQTPVAEGTKIHYYLDETIFAVTWKQGVDGCMYTISEVKVGHPSQLRRFLSGGEYGSGMQMYTTSMARTVNAVVATSGDFYAFRSLGVIVYDGLVRRVNSEYVDTCYIDDQGDMLFSFRGELTDVASAQEFVDENNIRFSVAFGPALIHNGQRIETYTYILGEIDDRYPRSILCQKDDLHYLIVMVNNEWPYSLVPDLDQAADFVETLNVRQAYTLDGGQTAVTAFNGQMINRVLFDSQRYISDIIYFATAVPEE